MTTRLDAAYLSIIAALGLELGCAGRTGEEVGDEAETEAETEDSTGDGDGDGDPGDGDGDGDPGDGDGDGDPGDGDGDPGDGDGDPPEPFVCLNPTPILQPGSDAPSGFVECEGGFIHRAEVVECVTPQEPDDSRCADLNGGCKTSAECMAIPYGSCQYDDFEGGCTCKSGCATDADCEAGQVCMCAGVYPTCIPAECASGDDCAGGLCGLSTQHGSCGDSYALACTTENDECHVDAECDAAPCPVFPAEDVPWYCTGSAGQGFSCTPDPSCAGICGRPLLVEGHARIATAVERGDWACAGTVTPLGAHTRQILANHWAQVGRFEHASVASFARFAMHLLRLGAPPRLLRETHAAMADEIEHARLAFGLASAYAEVEIGPGSLDVRGSIDAQIDRYAIVAALIDEACLGETLAAIEAGEAAALAEDPAVAAVLERIAADELRHAQLGWRSLRWMLDVGDDRLRRFALARLDAAVRELLAPVRDGVSVRLREHGLLDDELRTHVRRRAIVEVLSPCVATLRRWHEHDDRPASSVRA